MLIHLPNNKSTYLPSGTHPLVKQFIIDAFTGKYGDNPRFRFHFLSPFSKKLYEEGYMYRTYADFIEVVGTRYSYRSWPIQWELVHLIEFSNKRMGGEIVKLNKNEVTERFLT